MAILADIPTRDSLDGAAQLLQLRIYLGDTDSNDYQLPDDLLISLLVLNDMNHVWRDLLMIPELTDIEVSQGVTPIIAFSYNTDSPMERTSLVRAMIGDTEEASMVYTDYKIANLIEAMPLRRVVQAIKSNSSESTLPLDKNHPLRIIRELLGDTNISGTTMHTDGELMSAILDTQCNPYEYILSIIDRAMAVSSAEKGQESSGGFAAIDGISFSADKIDGSIETAENHREVVVGKMGNSVYNRGDDFAVFCDDEDISNGDSGDWYAI